MPTHSHKQPTRSGTTRVKPGRKSPHTRGATGPGSSAKATGKQRSPRTEKALDEAERKKIAASLDLAAFGATTEQTAAETAKEWAEPY